MSSHKRSWVLFGTHEHSGHSIVCCHGAMSALQCSWGLRAPWSHANDYSWELKISHKCSLVLPSAIGAMAPHSWVLLTICKHSWIFISSLEHSWALVVVCYQPWAHMSLVPWLQEYSWVVKSINWRHAVMSTYELSWHHDTILMSAHECSRVLRHCHWGLGVLLKDSESPWRLKCLNQQ